MKTLTAILIDLEHVGRGGSHAQQDVEWLSEYAGRRPPPQQSTSTLAPSSSTARSAHVFARYCFALVHIHYRRLLVEAPHCCCFSHRLETVAPCTQPPRLGSIHVQSTDRSDLHCVRLNTREPGASEPRIPFRISRTEKRDGCDSHSFGHALLLCMPTSFSSLAFIAREYTTKTPADTTRVAHKAPAAEGANHRLNAL